MGDGKFAGFHVEMCERILADVQKQLGLAKLDIKYQPVTSQNRIPLVQNGTVDIECGSTTNNAARQKDVCLRVTTYVEEVRIAVKANSGITSIAQLNGKNVATTTGTTSVQLLRKHERAAGVDFKEVFGKDHADSFLLLESGRADAFVMDGQILAGNIAKSKNPADFRIVGEVLSVEPIAIMLRKDDPAFKKAVDDSIKALIKSGEMAKIYDKWFMQPIPPANTDRPAGFRSHQGGLGQPERQAGGRLREEVISRAGEGPGGEGGSAPLPNPLPAAAGRGGANSGASCPPGTGRCSARTPSTARSCRAASAAPATSPTSTGCSRPGAGRCRCRCWRWWWRWLRLADGHPAHHAAPRLVLLGNAWTELFRNIPLLVQIFLWYHVCRRCARRCKACRASSWWCWGSGLFTSARISEQVKAGIQSLPRGQRIRRPGHGLHAAADLPLRAAADGLPHRHPAAHQRER
jgi:glutamate/aspartate transport system substrate-binding protein